MARTLLIVLVVLLLLGVIGAPLLGGPVYASGGLGLVVLILVIILLVRG